MFAIHKIFPRLKCAFLPKGQKQFVLGPKKKKQFADVLDRELAKDTRPENEAGPGAPNAYRLEISARPTQSLFYRGGVDLSKVEGKIHDAG